MKYVSLWEFSPEDLDKVVEKIGRVNAERQKVPEKYLKIVFPAHTFGGEFKGLTIVEVDNPEQIENLVVQVMPELKVKYVPLLEVEKLIELYQKEK